MSKKYPASLQQNRIFKGGAIGSRQEVIFGNLKMKLYIINSGSLGNGYLLESSDGEQLLIEAGRPLKEFSKYGNLKRSRARGMLISHEHG